VGPFAVYPCKGLDANHFRAMKPIPSAKRTQTALLSPDGEYLYLLMFPGERRGAKVFTFKVN